MKGFLSLPNWFVFSLFLAGWGALPTFAGEGLLVAGGRVQGSIDLQPGNDYFEGPTLGYSNYHLFNHKLQLQAAYLTNRLEVVFRPRVPVQDWYLMTPVWHWGRNQWFDPTFQLDLGWTWFDDEGLGLDNTAWLASPAFGLNFNLGEGRYGLHLGLGYQALTSSLVNPATAFISFWSLM